MQSVSKIVETLTIQLGKRYEALEQKLTKDIDTKVEERAKKIASDIIKNHLMQCAEKLKEAELLIRKQESFNRFPFNGEEFRIVLAALHPDSSPDFRLKAFQLVNKKKIMLRPEDKDWITKTTRLPDSVADLLAKRKVKRKT
jgi:hypothetical protein